MYCKEMKFDFNDISLIPAKLSGIKSRGEINILDGNGKLPIFVSPMDTVVDDENYKKFLELGMYVCIPRKNPNDVNDLYEDECFISYGLDEIETMVANNQTLPKRVLIDVANAHSIRVYEISKRIKELYDIELMVGNIANPETYLEYAKIGVDYIRCGIGAGQACTTSANSSIHYPMASLIHEISQIRINELNGKKSPKIIADGGFKNFDDIIKAIGIGADGVMLGSIINKSIESCGDNFVNDDNIYTKISKEEALTQFNTGVDIYKSYRGMSTKAVQKKWGKSELRTSEGISKYNKVEYSIAGWLDNFKDYLKSCMSYQGVYNIKDFIGNADFIYITQNSYNRFKK